jgi:hypothetical protein
MVAGKRDGDLGVEGIEDERAALIFCWSSPFWLVLGQKEQIPTGAASVCDALTHP